MSKKDIIRKTILLILAAACLAFIWINSTLPAEDSGNLSGYVLNIINKMLNSRYVLSEHILRKLAHCAEFAALGVFLSLFLYDKLTRRISLIEFCGIFAAVCDETIQIFSAGRTSRVKDIWIDFGGFTAGVLFILLINILFRGRKGKKGGYED